MRGRVVALGTVAFVVALALRLANAPVAISNGIPRISLLDDLYHFKRISYTVVNFPRVLDFDRDRGVRGEFCPWPPLYDSAAAVGARLLGARTPAETLRRAAWFAPFGSAVFVAIAAVVVARYFGLWAACALAVALATSPFLIAESSIGNIDHHYLEAPLTFGILLATCGCLRAAGRRQAMWHGAWLGLALIASLFVRPSLLVAAALAFVILFALSDGLAASCGFAIAALVVAVYRATRPAGYPNSAWFLGWSHAALLGGAAAASFLLFLYGRSIKSRVVALACGVAAVALTPTALSSIIFGSEYFGGNAWFRTIAEGQALWNARGSELVWRMTGLSTGAIFVWIMLIGAVRRRDWIDGAIAVFAAVYLLLTLSDVRFWSVGIPLLALAGSVFAASFRRRWVVILLCIAVGAPPVWQWMVLRRQPMPPVVDEQQLPWLRAALFLREQPGKGRVLAPWSLGHVIDVIGKKPVIIDNFGIMSNPIEFERAHDAFLARDEEALFRYCQGTNVRFIVLDNPLYGLQGAAATLGLPPSRFVITNEHGEPSRITRLATATWWWRAYYERGAPSGPMGMFGRPFRHFRLVYLDPQPSWRGTPAFRGPAVMIWERLR